MKSALLWLLNAIDHIIYKQEKIVLRGYPDLEDQCLSVLMALARRGYSGRVIWLMRTERPRIVGYAKRYGLEALRLKGCRTSSIEALFHFVTARYVFFTHGTYSQGDWGNYSPPRHKTVVNMWHGMPIKAIWRLLPQAVEPPRADVLLATSERFQRVLVNASGMDKSRIWISGLPRNDLLQQRNSHSEDAIGKLVGERRWFLYLPTYRKSKRGNTTEDGREHDSVLSMSEKDAAILDQWLKESGEKLVVKAHPMSVHSSLCCEWKTENIVVISENWLMENQLTLYALTAYSSGLITDISSIAVDYLLLGKPVFIYFPDQQAYEQGRGTVFDSLEDNLPGEICVDVESLLVQMDSFLKGDDLSSGRRNRLLSEWHSVPAGEAGDRLLDALNVK